MRGIGRNANFPPMSLNVVALSNGPCSWVVLGIPWVRLRLCKVGQHVRLDSTKVCVGLSGNGVRTTVVALGYITALAH